jgi:hypothetical protein
MTLFYSKISISHSKILYPLERESKLRSHIAVIAPDSMKAVETISPQLDVQSQSALDKNAVKAGPIQPSQPECLLGWLG